MQCTRSGLRAWKRSQLHHEMHCRAIAQTPVLQQSNFGSSCRAPDVSDFGSVRLGFCLDAGCWEVGTDCAPRGPSPLWTKRRLPKLKLAGKKGDQRCANEASTSRSVHRHFSTRFPPMIIPNLLSLFLRFSLVYPAPLRPTATSRVTIKASRDPYRLGLLA